MKLKIAQRIEGGEVYWVKTPEFCKLFMLDCRAKNYDRIPLLWDEYKSNTCFRLYVKNEEVWVSYANKNFYTAMGAKIVEYKPNQRSE